jgi:hypothetical protein
MSAIPQAFVQKTAELSDEVTRPFPSSRKVYVTGSRPDLRVPMREVTLTPTQTKRGSKRIRRSWSTTPPDPTRTRPRGSICLRAWPICAALDRGARRHRAARRTHLRLRARASIRPAARASALRAYPHPASRQARAQRHPDALRATRHRHARDGVRRHPREHAPGCAARRPALREASAPASRPFLRRQPARDHHGRIRPRRDRPRARHHPGQHQSPRARAHDHRAQLPGEDQHQHRQLGRHLRHRGRGREDGLVGALGRRHPDGSLHRQEHPRDPRVDPAQRAGADRHRAHLPGAREGRRQARGADLGDVPRHPDRAGRAGRGLFHHPRRRAAALCPADRGAPHRHRLARRLHPGQVVSGTPPRRTSSTRTSARSARS